MSLPETSPSNSQSLGQLLKGKRKDRGFDLKTITQETRITAANIQAIEEDNYDALPAPVFARGCYQLYAKFLGLDTNEILERYDTEYAQQIGSNKYNTPPPGRLVQDIGNMATKPNGFPFSYLGLFLLIFLAFGAFLCWYFSWNPAAFLSKQLRGIENTLQVEPVAKSINEKAKTSSGINNLSIASFIPSNFQSVAFAAPVPTDDFGEQILPEKKENKYFLYAEFPQQTELILTIDNQPYRRLCFLMGERVTWSAAEELTLTLPTSSNVKLTLNTIPLQLPHSEKDYVTISVSELLL